MKAQETSFEKLVGEANYLEVPFFQRHYKWGRDNWKILYDDLKSAFDSKSGHFLGSVVLRRNETHDNFAHIIDGQQRLTTFSIMLKVALDKLDDNKDYEQHVTDITRRCLFEKDKYDKSPRIRHSKADRDIYVKLLKDEIKDEKEGIFGCYKFFKDKLESDFQDDEKLLNFIKFIRD